MKRKLLLPLLLSLFTASCDKGEPSAETSAAPAPEPGLKDKAKTAGKEIREAFGATVDLSGEAVSELDKNTRDMREAAWEGTKRAATKAGEFLDKNAGPAAEWTKEKAGQAADLAKEGVARAGELLPPKEEVDRVTGEVKESAKDAWRYLREKAAEAIKPKDGPAPKP